MRRSSAIVVLLATASMAAFSANAGELRGMELIQDGAVTRATIELGSLPDYRLFSLAGPDRVVIDLPDTAAASGLRLPGANGLVAAIRTGQPAPGTLRLVLDLGRAVATSSRIDRSGARPKLIIELRDPSWRGPAPVSAPIPAMPAPVVVRVEPKPPVPAPSPLPPPVISSPAPVFVQAAVPTPVVVPPPSRPRGLATKTVRDVLGTGRRELVIAVDAGHGGKDPGAHGPSGLLEKRVTLAVARELARQIDAEPGMRAVLIRDDDTFVPLERRFQKARRAQADLFISIHADAAPSSAASGASVFVLSTRGASSQAARWLADKENAADLVGGVSLDDKDRSLSAVLLDLSQSATMRVSDDVAGQVLAALKNVGKAHKRDVERANFVVLRSPDVPSMLVETGFITNPGEERKLDDPEYRRRLADAIVGGVRGYFTLQPPPGTWFAARIDEPATATATMLATSHVVGRGETLSLIAHRHGVGVDSLRQANRLRGDRVRIGERLTIPASIMAGTPE
ncbi:MAG: N-acetylmuramoyl-L-alanine amidase [Arenimonas sp.]